MLESAWAELSVRKLCLLNVASCQQLAHLLPPGSWAALDVFERWADGTATTAEFDAASRQRIAEAQAADRDPPDARTYATSSVGMLVPPTIASFLSALDTSASAAACDAADQVPDDRYDEVYDDARMRAVNHQAQLVRDIFGNPFRPVTASPSWLTTTALSLARQMYESRDFAPMPILADALEGAGCDDADVLGHCRGPGPHVRGCWVVDLVLGKS
jgi:hypothetical protein